MKSYMIALRGSHEDWNSKSPSEMQAVLEEYMAWVDTLRKSGAYEYSLPLTGNAKVLKSKNQQVEIADGPYAESKEALTGFFIVKAETLEKAVEIAQDCPALRHGEEVDVIEVGEH